MPSVLSYLFRSAPQALARSQAMRNQLAMQERERERALAERQRQEQAQLERMVMMEHLRQQGQTNEATRRTMEGASTRMAATNKGLADLRATAAALRVPNAMTLDAPTLKVRIPEAQQAAERTRQQGEKLTELRGTARALGIVGSDQMDGPTLAVRIKEEQDKRAGAESDRRDRLQAGLRPPPVGERPRQVPANVVKDRLDNEAIDSAAEDAIRTIGENPDALGLKNLLPAGVTQRIRGEGFAGGVSARQHLDNVKTTIRRTIAGMSLTTGEKEALLNYLPNTTDNAQTALEKLNNLKVEIRRKMQQQEAAFSPEYGWKGFPGGTKRRHPDDIIRGIK